MPQSIYEALALIFSYWFCLLGVLIVLRGARWVRRDAQLRRRALLTLPDAGTVGELTVLRGKDKLEKGTCIPIPPEGVLGSARACDVRIPHEEVPARAAHFALTREGLMLTPWQGTALRIEGQTYADPITLSHGNRLEWGGLVLRLRLFEGVEGLALGSAPMAKVRAKRRKALELEEGSETAPSTPTMAEGTDATPAQKKAKTPPVKRNLKGKGTKKREEKG